MSPESITLIVVVALMLALFSGLQVGFCLLGLGVLFDLIFFGPRSLYLVYSSLISNLRTEVYISIPLFVFMACLLEFSGIAGDLYETMHKWMGGLRGGLAMGTCIICALIDAMSGLGATATVTMGVLALPEMLKRGYNKEMAVGCIPCGGALGPLIPPSVIMVIMGGLTGLSVGKLFIGGFIPGFLITFGFCVYIGIRCILQPQMGPALPREEWGTWSERVVALRGVILPILIVVLIMGGIYSGACTPTEASGIGAMATFIVVIVRRKFTWKGLTNALYASMKITCMVLWLLIGGTVFASFLNSVGVSAFLATVITGISSSQMVVIWVMAVIALIMGCFIDGSSILMICTPIFFPVVYALNIDPIYFGVVFTMAIVIGYVTPPFGANLFYMKGLVPKDISMWDIWRSVFPYTIIMLIGLALCIHFPVLIMWFPNMMK